MNIKIILGTDHAGFGLKEEIKKVLTEWGYEVKDFGAFELNSEDDYPDFVIPVAREVSRATAQINVDKKNTQIDADNEVRGIIIGGSGQGEAMCANRFLNVRAAVYYGRNTDIVKLSREHNDANVLSLGARFLSKEEATEAVKIWLQTPFSGNERHVRRIKKIDSR